MSLLVGGFLFFGAYKRSRLLILAWLVVVTVVVFFEVTREKSIFHFSGKVMSLLARQRTQSSDHMTIVAV